jgi:hypothetical protein
MFMPFVAAAALPRLHRVSEVVRVLASSSPPARRAFATLALEEVGAYIELYMSEPLTSRARLSLFWLATSSPESVRFEAAANALRDVVRAHALEVAADIHRPAVARAARALALTA